MPRTSSRLIWILGLILIAGGPGARAFNSEGTTAGPIKWNASPVHYRFNNGTPTLRNIFKNALAAWTKGSALAVQNDGDDASGFIGLDDGENLIRFAESGDPDDDALLCGAPAVSIITTDRNNKIIDADLLIDPLGPVANAAMHEAGHFFGLAHSAVLSAVMFPDADARRDWITALDGDDQAAMDALYPSASIPAAQKRGKITGKVTVSQSGRSVPVYGAHVVAVNLDNGLVACGALTKGVNQGSVAGSYELAGLMPGKYRLYAEPVDGPLSAADWTGGYAAGGYWGGVFTQHYRTTEFLSGTRVDVAAGAVSANKNIVVTPDTADTRVNLARGAIYSSTSVPPPASTLPMPLYAVPGSSIKVCLYGKLNGSAFRYNTVNASVTVPDRTTVAADRKISITGITTGASAGYPYIAFTLNIPKYQSGADRYPLGTHNIEIEIPNSNPNPNTKEKVMFSGGLIVKPAWNDCRNWDRYE